MCILPQEHPKSHLGWYLSKDQGQNIVVMWQPCFTELHSLFSISASFSAELSGPVMFFIKEILQNLNMLCCLCLYVDLTGRN